MASLQFLFHLVLHHWCVLLEDHSLLGSEVRVEAAKSLLSIRVEIPEVDKDTKHRFVETLRYPVLTAENLIMKHPL